MLTKPSNTVLYFAPHQDDELLTMGIDIAASVKNGYDVHVIMVTDGSSSNVRLRLGNREFCEQCHEQHVFDLTKADFTATRDQELFGSCDALGVKRENVHFPEERIVDGNITLERAKEIIKDFVERIDKECTVCTIYPNAPEAHHKDHRTLGLAAVELYNEGVVKHLVTMEEPYVAVEVDHAPGEEPTIFYAPDDIAEQIEKAVSSYFLWDPANKRYAVGFHSVPDEMNQLITEKALYYHTYE
ncbi:MAG: PIG-L family deacetylase [Eubacterium sp.]|nr:PIG-L family deacetylase [Eubacterium sp.]